MQDKLDVTEERCYWDRKSEWENLSERSDIVISERA